MIKNQQRLPGVKAIGWLPAKNLPTHIPLHAICGMQVLLMAEVFAVPFVGEPECKCQTEKEDGGWLDTAELTFQSVDLLPFRQQEDVAFVVVDVEGRGFVIGSREKPHAVISAEVTAGKVSGESAVFTYKVKHCDIRSLIPCKVFSSFSIA